MRRFRACAWRHNSVGSDAPVGRLEQCRIEPVGGFKELEAGPILRRTDLHLDELGREKDIGSKHEAIGRGCRIVGGEKRRQTGLARFVARDDPAIVRCRRRHRLPRTEDRLGRPCGSGIDDVTSRRLDPRSPGKKARQCYRNQIHDFTPLAVLSQTGTKK